MMKDFITKDDIIINKDIRKKWHAGWKRKAEPAEIVIHGTGGGASSNSQLKWMLKDGRPKEYKKGIALFHYLIGYTGEIIEIIDPMRWVYHSSSGRHDKQTIGIEMLNPSFDNSEPYQQLQYDSLFQLFEYLRTLYPIGSIVSHSYNKLKFSGERKNCPGEGFSWIKLEDWLLSENISYENHPGIQCFKIEQDPIHASEVA